MKILMTGATGLIGKEVGKKLVEEGHELTVLTRSAQEARSTLPFPAKILEWKHYSEAIPSHYFDDIDSVIHLAGESIAGGRWTKKKKKLILDSRKVGTHNIVQAIKESNRSVKQFISASAIGIYGNHEEVVNEATPPAKDFLAKVCVEWEKEADALRDININVIHPRISIVLSNKGGALEKMLPVFSLGLGGVLGSGKQWMSWIHLEDLARLFVFFTKRPDLSGCFNAVAPNPVTNRDFSKMLAHSLGKNLFLPVPKVALKLGLGEMSQLLLEGQNVSAQKIINEGFHFKYSDLTSALESLCSPLKWNQKELIAEIWLPKKREELFKFFSDEKNLEKITPKYLNFKVLKMSTDHIQKGTLIDYKLSLHGIPVIWKTHIEEWKAGEKFIDTQIKGPYKFWHHTHEFIDFAGGTLMRDRVLYKVPLGQLGDMVAGHFVQSDVKNIFSFRKKIISQMFS